MNFHNVFLWVILYLIIVQYIYTKYKLYKFSNFFQTRRHSRK